MLRNQMVIEESKRLPGQVLLDQIPSLNMSSNLEFFPSCRRGAQIPASAPSAGAVELMWADRNHGFHVATPEEIALQNEIEELQKELAEFKAGARYLTDRLNERGRRLSTR